MNIQKINHSDVSGPDIGATISATETSSAAPLARIERGRIPYGRYTPNNTVMEKKNKKKIIY